MNRVRVLKNSSKVVEGSTLDNSNLSLFTANTNFPAIFHATASSATAREPCVSAAFYRHSTRSRRSRLFRSRRRLSQRQNPKGENRIKLSNCMASSSNRDDVYWLPVQGNDLRAFDDFPSFLILFNVAGGKLSANISIMI